MRHLSWAVPRAFVGNAADRSCRLRLRHRCRRGGGLSPRPGAPGRRQVGHVRALPWARGRESPRWFREIMRKALTEALRAERCATETQQMQPKRKSCIINQLQVNPPSPVFTQFCRLFVQVEPFDGFPAQRDCLSGAPTRPWGILHFARRPAFWPIPTAAFCRRRHCT